ncbi:hypothetical protein [Burkholderia ambifaria]|uniref:hypothetical protein n=1 Tax=Burkholderia ambifaria TaxID=152480 RepID=UPI00158BE4D2|nr:hypothetical protein [Burkholderia ambifaria]
MTTVAEYQGTYHWHSTKASDVSRQLGFAGIAVIWLFKTQATGSPTITMPALLDLPLALIVLSLSLDLFQYIWQSMLWGVVWRLFERRHGLENDDHFEVSKYLNWPAIGIFWLKLLTMIVGYICLLKYLTGVLIFNK